MTSCAEKIEQFIAENPDPGPILFEKPNCQGSFFPSTITNTYHVNYNDTTTRPGFDTIMSVWIPANSEMIMTKDEWSIKVQSQIIEDTTTSLIWNNKLWESTDPTNTETPPKIDWSDIDSYFFTRISNDSRDQIETASSNTSGLVIPIVISVVIFILIMFALFWK